MSERAADDPADIAVPVVRHGSDVLCVRLESASDTGSGRWSLVAGDTGPTPDERARTAVVERTDLDSQELSLVRAGEPVSSVTPDGGCEWAMRPVLFECARRDIELREAAVTGDRIEWRSPVALRGDEVVIKNASGGRAAQAVGVDVWRLYDRIGPTVETIANDGEHGAAFLSVRALEVLRDNAVTLLADSPSHTTHEEWEALAACARRLLTARPSMAVLRNRVNRAMSAARDGESRTGDARGERASEANDIAGENAAGASGLDGDSTADTEPAPASARQVLAATRSQIDRAHSADTAAATTAGSRLTGTVLTLSRSGTVKNALEAGTPTRVFVAESRPGREGVAAAEAIAATDAIDAEVTVHADAAAAHVLASGVVDRVVVGADTITPAGDVVNKTGTRTVALAAAHENVPVSVVAASDKVSPRENVTLESGPSSAVYAGEAALEVVNPTFDVTPAVFVDEIVTERGAVEPGEVEAIAAELRAAAAWDDREGVN